MQVYQEFDAHNATRGHQTASRCIAGQQPSSSRREQPASQCHSAAIPSQLSCIRQVSLTQHYIYEACTNTNRGTLHTVVVSMLQAMLRMTGRQVFMCTFGKRRGAGHVVCSMECAARLKTYQAIAGQL